MLVAHRSTWGERAFTAKQYGSSVEAAAAWRSSWSAWGALLSDLRLDAWRGSIPVSGDCHPIMTMDVGHLDPGEDLEPSGCILSNLCETTHQSGLDVLVVCGTSPKSSTGHFRGIPTTKFLHMSCVDFFFSLVGLQFVRMNNPRESEDSPGTVVCVLVGLRWLMSLLGRCGLQTLRIQQALVLRAYWHEKLNIFETFLPCREDAGHEAHTKLTSKDLSGAEKIQLWGWSCASWEVLMVVALVAPPQPAIQWDYLNNTALLSHRNVLWGVDTRLKLKCVAPAFPEGARGHLAISLRCQRDVKIVQ